MNQDIRWEQRFANFRKALEKLKQAITFINQKSIDKTHVIDNGKLDFVFDEMIKEGLIQRFEYTHELAWNVMKDYSEFQGNPDIGGSRDSTRAAFQLKLIEDGKVWIDMIGSRNKTSHTYNEDIANEIYLKIIEDYYPAFLAFEINMEHHKSGNQEKLF